MKLNSCLCMLDFNYIKNILENLRSWAKAVVSFVSWSPYLREAQGTDWLD